MDIKEKIFIKLFGDKGLEAYFLDSFLISFEDGQARDNIPSTTGYLANVQSRVEEKLIKDGFLKSRSYQGVGYIITSEGKLHLDNGGYKGQLIDKQLSRLSLWIGIFAFVISIWAFIRTF